MAEDTIRHVNYASDFRVVFSFPDNKLPDYPWRIELTTPNTSAYNTYVASFDGAAYKRCMPLEDNSILVLVDRHNLAPGILCYQMRCDAPDDLFPDGEINITTPGCTCIELWDGTSEELSTEHINTIIATLRGEPGAAGRIEDATASVDETSGVPNVDVELGGTPENRTIGFRFSGLKGSKGDPGQTGDQGDRGPAGTAAEITEASATVGNLAGDPEVKVELGGTPDRRTLHFAFDGLTPAITADAKGVIYSNGERVTDALKHAIDYSAVQTARAASLADHPPVIVEVAGNGYWAFWDEETQDYATSTYRSDDGLLVESVTGADVALEIVGGRIYLCGNLASLDLLAVETSEKLSIVRFASGAVATQFSYPESLLITGWSIPQANTSYSIFIWQGAATIVYDE